MICIVILLPDSKFVRLVSVVDHLEHPNQKPVEAMRYEDAREFVQANHFAIEAIPEANQPWNLRCVDDRENRTHENGLPDIAIPGAGLGLVMDAFAGLNLLEKEKGVTIHIDAKRIVEVVEGVVGEISFHTDEDNIREDNPLICAGCGHCAGAIKDPEAYLLTDSAIHFLKGSLLPRLTEQGEKPTVYKGAHGAKAFFIIDAEDVGLPAQSGDSQAYVYNRALHEKAIREIGKRLYSGLYVERVSEDEFVEIFLRATEKRVGETVFRLARTLPKYRILQGKEGIEVDEIKEEVESPGQEVVV